ncbi:helix-turn-helix domain-containing protein [Curtobacterium flaccumfaciens pv. flaccumfaciens]|uniref:helix-turn-helix transcriptional regulator n=1 Tax=Curtobacterium flaccumfaciens TaxID=2035 RepID=UPI00217CD89C|nr:helix-turn-helix transcriptional regulator [Curtobacterium flaccumfaciens]MCS6570285.1 helix-turn-helix domain-containing protein [Curtobacterium flaccumfaciens pv. flaccumfaciens]MCS6585141.1 helix-turn-helix domain-containing protein [Curtobacterium flaccumfaciens pv. flaccumfaciens]
MSSKNWDTLTADERAEWAGRVKTLRLAADLTQQELATEAKTSRQTINNMENGYTPQLATLKRVLNVLGVNTDPVEFERQTEMWLATMGTLIEAIPEERRGKHVDLAIGDLADGVRETRSNVVAFPTVGGATDYEDGSHQAVASRKDEGGVEEDDEE